MTRPRDAASNRDQSFSLLDPFQLLSTWLRSTRAAFELTAGGQQLLQDRGRALADAMVDAQLGPEVPVAGSVRAWQQVLEWWEASAIEAQELVETALVELRFSARELLGQLAREQAAHQRRLAERERARERLEREVADQKSRLERVERDRDHQRERADRERTERQRLERELAQAQQATATAAGT